MAQASSTRWSPYLRTSRHRVHATHARPRKRAIEQNAGELSDVLAVALGLALEEVDVAHGVRALLLGKVIHVRGAAAGERARVRLDDHRGIVEGHGRAVGAGTQQLSDKAVRQRIERTGDLGVLVASGSAAT